MNSFVEIFNIEGSFSKYLYCSKITSPIRIIICLFPKNILTFINKVKNLNAKNNIKF